MKLRGLSALVAGLLFAVTGQCLAQSWQVPYGNDKGKVAVFNSKTDPKFAEDSPFGPMSFRLHQGQLWLLDSIGGKLLCFGEKQELKSELVVPGLPVNVMLEDFAFGSAGNGKPESVWIADGADCTIRKISLASGKELLKIGGNGNESGKFLQIHQLEVDRGGRLYVGDYGRNLIAVFTQYGELIREIPWQNSGFALDSKGRLHLLAFREKAGHFHRIYSQQGQLERNRHLGFNSMLNPRVWSVSADGNLLVSFVPADGFKGHLKLYELSQDGLIVNRLELSPPGSMNRFVDYSANRLWLAEADFFAAPEGGFRVKGLEWDGKK